jgi:hypothetical protein
VGFQNRLGSELNTINAYRERRHHYGPGKLFKLSHMLVNMGNVTIEEEDTMSTVAFAWLLLHGVFLKGFARPCLLLQPNSGCIEPRIHTQT